MSKQRVIIVGNGMVGHHFVDQLVQSNVDADITVIGGETRPAYDRVHLSEVFSGKEPAELALTSRDYYKSVGVAAHFGDPVAEIDRANKLVVTEGGRRFSYDKLVLATGSYPFVPPISGGKNKNCLTYRTINDLGQIKARAKNGKVGVVVGGGLLGFGAVPGLGRK